MCTTKPIKKGFRNLTQHEACFLSRWADGLGMNEDVPFKKVYQLWRATWRAGYYDFIAWYAHDPASQLKATKTWHKIIGDSYDTN